MFARATKFCKTFNRENLFVTICVIFTIFAAAYAMYVGHAFGELDPTVKSCIDKAGNDYHTNHAVMVKAIKACYPPKQYSVTVKIVQDTSNVSAITAPSSFGIVGLQLSDNCIHALKENATTDCPTYLPIIPLDNTNKAISGGFVNDSGFVHRQTPPVKNDWKFWNDGKKPYVIVVDPTADDILLSPMHLIIIDPKSHPFVESAADATNSTWTSYQDPYVEQNCHVARIGWNYTVLINTINYMLSDCKSTLPATTQVHKIPDPVLDWKHGLANQVWLDQAKKSSKTQLCIIKACPDAPVAKHYQGYGN